jgi:hypothetical protein
MANDLEKHLGHASTDPTEKPDTENYSAGPILPDATPDDHSDRRAMRRARTDLFVNRFLNGHPYLCRMTDISLSGARLVAINEPRISPPPVFMGLQFQLPGRREVLTASGEAVTREGEEQDGHAVGVRFTRLPPAAAAAIEALLTAA